MAVPLGLNEIVETAASNDGSVRYTRAPMWHKRNRLFPFQVLQQHEMIGAAIERSIDKRAHGVSMHITVCGNILHARCCASISRALSHLRRRSVAAQPHIRLLSVLSTAIEG